jgi:hypothetical protein
MKFDWKKTLATVAPALATALGGPLAGVAVGMATKALGIEGDENALAAAIASGDPSILVKLKEVDNNFLIEMERLGVDLERVHAGDRGSARDMASKTSIVPQSVLSTIFVCGFILVLDLLFNGTESIHKSMMQPAMYVLGILSAGLGQVMNFWFGSSSGSIQKTDAISKLKNG